MTTSALKPDFEQIECPPRAGQGGELLRIPADRVAAGMFIADLDRPWDDTPLPHNGLLVETDEELAAVRRYCRTIVVDTGLSDVRCLSEIHAAAARADGRDAAGVDRTSGRPTMLGRRLARPAQLRDDIRLGPGSRQRVRLLAAGSVAPADACAAATTAAAPRPAGLLARLRSRSIDRADRAGPATPETLRARFGPPVADLRWPAPTPVPAALDELRPVFAGIVRAVADALAQVRRGALLPLPRVFAAADSLVSAVLKSPDAVRWLVAIHQHQAGGWEPAVADGALMVEFGRHLGMPREALLELATIGLLADVGTLLLPRDLLDHPGMLSAPDFALVTQHVSLSIDLVERAGSLPPAVMRGIAEHHERLDGSGYPAGLAGEAVGLYGRMAGIVDNYSALTSARSYAKPLAPEDALAALLDWSDRLFCRALVEQFTAMLGAFPAGSLVELTSGEVAVVAERNPARSPSASPSPTLVVLTGPDKGPLRPVHERGGAPEPDQVYRGLRVRIAQGLPAGAYGLRIRDPRGPSEPAQPTD